MRHRKSGRKFNRKPAHRKALLRNLAKALLSSGRITTTEAKAKTLRGVVEPLITLALKNDLHARRQAYDVLGDHQLVKRLFDDIGPLFAGGGGGYTRVVKLALPRKGDAAPLAIIELVRKPGEAVEEAAPAAKAAKVKKAAAPKKEDEGAKAAPKKKKAEEPAEPAKTQEAAAAGEEAPAQEDNAAAEQTEEK